MSPLEELAQYSKPSLSPGSLEEKYYLLLKKGASKETILKELFSGVESPGNRISQLGTSLKWKMIASIAVKVNTSESSYEEMATKAYQLTTAGSILVHRNAKKTAIELLEKGFKLAIKAGLVGKALECAKELTRYYGVISGDTKKYEYYQNAKDELLDRYVAENKAESYFIEVSGYFAKSWHEDVSAKAFTYAALTEETIEASINTAISHYSMLNLAYISSLDFRGLVENCNEAIIYFSGIENKPRATLEVFFIKQAFGYILLGEHKKARRVLDESISISKEGGYAWCTAQFYKGIIGLHSGNIELSENAASNVEPYHNTLSNNIQEQWKILMSYVALFSDIKFRVAKFLNEVPIFEKNKASANFAILTVQMLHFLKEGNEDAYTERCDALVSYTSRHLKGKSKILAKMLVEVSRGHFHEVSVEARVKSMKKKLQGFGMEIEIMPYPKIWDLVVSFLK